MSILESGATEINFHRAYAGTIFAGSEDVFNYNIKVQTSYILIALRFNCFSHLLVSIILHMHVIAA